MTREQAEAIAEQMVFRGFANFTADDVLEFEREGSLPPSVISDHYDDAREDALRDLIAEVS